MQVPLQSEQYRAIAALAEERRVSVASVVREALDHYLTSEPERRRRAADRILAADGMKVGDPDEVRAERRDHLIREGALRPGTGDPSRVLDEPPLDLPVPPSRFVVDDRDDRM